MIERTDKLRELRHRSRDLEKTIEDAQRELSSTEVDEKEHRKELVTKKANEILADEPLVLALGTTGTYAPSDRICEIVLMDREGRLAFHSLVRPDKPVSVEATAIHGQDESSLEDAPTFGEIAADYIAAAGERRIVAWSGKFEREFLRCRAEENNIPTATVPAPQEAEEYQYAREREADSVGQLLKDLLDSDSEPHGSANPTPVGVARTIWRHLESLSEGKRWDGKARQKRDTVNEEDFEDIPF